MRVVEPVFQEVRPKLLLYVRRLIKEARSCGMVIRCEADDILQDVFLDVSGTETFNPSNRGAAGYFFYAARNHVVNHIRSDRKKKVVSFTVLDTETDSSMWFVDPNGEEPSSILIREEESIDVQRAVESARLSERERDAVALRYFSERSYAVIAEAMHTTVGAVTGLLSRGLTKLRGVLGWGVDPE
jgi:RNA polymerase sigma-70 factor, ECF subfamily